MPKIFIGHIIVLSGMAYLCLFAGLLLHAQAPIKKIELKNNYNDTTFSDSSLAILAEYMSRHFVVVKHYVNRKNGEEILYVKAGWKSYKVIYVTDPFHHSTEAVTFGKKVSAPFLKVHGNVLYDIDYRSYIDTPFAEKDIYQHTIQTYLDITVKDRYPVRVYLTNHFSNSRLLRDFSSLNFRFDQQQYIQKIREQLKAKIEQNLLLNDSANSLLSSLTKRRSELGSLKTWLNNPATLQKLIEAKEHVLLKGKNDILRDSTLPNNVRYSINNVKSDSLLGFQNPSLRHTFLSESDSILNVDLNKKNNNKTDSFLNEKLAKVDSLRSRWEGRLDEVSKKGDSLQKNKFAQFDSINSKKESFLETYEHKKKIADSLERVIEKLEQRYIKIRQIGAVDLAKQRSEIDHISNSKELEKKCGELNIADSSLPKGYKKLSAIRSFGIGSNILDYSELTAKGISVNGIQAEFNPSYYVALASGYIDYRSRDYFISGNAPKQYLTILRYGRGMKDGNNLIFSYYFGKRQLFNSSTTIQNGTVPTYNLVGYSLEGHYRINKTNELVAEFAKSSFPYYSGQNADKGSLIAGAVRYGERSNEAYTLKYLTQLKKTDTKITASISSLGNNFQSFSVFTTGTARTDWALKLEQPFWKQRIHFVASIRTNDFVYPNISGTLKNSTVFKSLQVTLKMKKWPIVSLGYYPSDQVTKVSSTQYLQSLFYTLSATVTHFYQYRQLNMNSALVYSRFYNKPQDSGFAYFNSRNLLISHNVFLEKWSNQTMLSVSANTDYALYTLESSCQFKISWWLSAGTGLKYNRQSITHTTLWGFSANAIITVKQFGEFQLMVYNGYIPGSSKRLVPNNIGRLSYFRSF